MGQAEDTWSATPLQMQTGSSSLGFVPQEFRKNIKPVLTYTSKAILVHGMC